MEAEFGKEKIKVPFNTYDLFGYFIPGAILLLAVYSFEFWGKYQLLYCPLLTAIDEVVTPIHAKENWVSAAMFLIVLVIITYAVGHIVSAISTFLLDRVLIAKGYDYPYKSFLGMKKTTEKNKKDIYWEKRLYSGDFYKGLFFWVNAYLLLRYYHISQLNIINQIDISYYIGRYITIMAKKFFSYLPDSDIVSYSVYWYILIMFFFKLLISISYFRDNSLSDLFTKVLKSLFRWLFAGPYNLLSGFFSGFVGSRESVFQKEFINLYKK